MLVLTQKFRTMAPWSRPAFEAVAMQGQRQIVLRLIAVAAVGCALVACSSDLGLNNVTLVPKPETLLRKPDWATFSGGKNEFELRPVTAADLVNAQGQCASGLDQQAVGTEGASPPAPV